MDEHEVARAASEADAVPRLSKESWRAHIANAEKFPGSEAEYCRRNGLKVGHFKANKRKLGLTRRYGPRKKIKKAFIKVESQPAALPPMQAEARARPKAEMTTVLPDARWLARFAAELVASR